MQDVQTCEFGASGDDEIGYRGAAVLASVGQQHLNL